MHYIPLITPIIQQRKVDQVLEAIHVSQEIVITTHRSPDGDALGASLALYHFLKRQGKQVRVIVPNPFPHFLRWMEGSNEVEVYEYNPTAGQRILTSADLIFCLDFNLFKRVEPMALPLEESPAKKVLIDHHPFPGEGFDITISHPEIASTCELLFRFLKQAGAYPDLTKAEAECIYCGMMTDTGGFTFNSSDPEIYEVVSLLLRKGIDKDEIYANVFHNYSESRFRLLGFMLSQRMEVYPELHSALLYLSMEDQAQFEFNKGDTEGFANFPLSIKDIIFSTFIREEDGLVKLSFRSRQSFPCNEFAAEFFNGGGHLNAAGGEFHGPFEEALEIYAKGLKQYEKKIKKAFNPF
ncbi:MAG: bifunctional oligoribonuclease/PAP phosphatase NrnA [Bacteroidota bacterium]|jgi:phosphoesterase RecJ-like protein|nr:bifunctional oligoribonuclease/PAP phosphatase NrnA [Bacteroidota bacterium]